MFKLKPAAGLLGLLATLSMLSPDAGPGRPATSIPADRDDAISAPVFAGLGSQRVAAAPAEPGLPALPGDSPEGGDTEPLGEDFQAGDDTEPTERNLPTGAELAPVGSGAADGADAAPFGDGGAAGIEPVPIAGGNLLSGAEPLAAANTISLPPTADVYVRAGGDAGRNFGTSKSIKAMKSSKDDNPPTQSYLRFEVGAVGPIAKATLRLYCNNDSRDSFDVYTTSVVNWDERAMTWNNKPAADGAKVASVMAAAENRWVEVDVTAAVRASSAVALALLPRSTDAFGANSREESANQPVLVLELAPPGPQLPAADDPVETTIIAEADAFVRSDKPTTNYGAQPKVSVDRSGGGAGDAEYGFLRFRIGDVGNLAQATLRLHVAGASDDSANVHFVSSSAWSEAAITWNNKPAVDGPVAGVIGDTSSGKWVEVDVSSLVTPNSQLTLALVPRSSDGFDVTSREGANKPELVLKSVGDDALNLDCTLIIPDNPLSPAGLATPYELVATDPEAGACHEYIVDQRGFVEAAILDPATGQVSIYHPLVIDKGTVAAAAPVLPVLPPNAVVAIWLGYNGDFLRQRGATPTALAGGRCVGGIGDDAMGQFSYCNAVAFFEAARRAIAEGKLVVPPLGTASDGLPCPNVRDFFTVDQDQSDNVLTTYLLTADGRLAQNTAANRGRLGASAKVIVNPSDNRVTSVLLDSALGCTPWNAPSLDNPGEMVPSLALNELLAAKWQPDPAATVPLLDPFALLEDGTPSLAKLNLHRAGVDHAPIATMDEAIRHQLAYCRDLRAIQPARLFRNQAVLSGRPSPFPDIGNSAFAFLVTRFNVSWELLTCTQQIGLASPITLIQNADGITTGATLGQ